MLIVVILAILLAFAYWGYKKGLLKIAVSVISLIVSILLTTIIAPIITNTIKDNSTIDENLAQYFYETISSNESVQGYLKSNELANQTVDTSSLNQIAGKVNEIVRQVGEKFDLPESIVDALDDESSSEILKATAEYGNTSVNDIAVHLVALSLSNIVFNALVYVVILIVLYLIFRLLLIFTNIIERIPFVDEANNALGLLLGLCEGVLVVWLLFIVITAMGNTTLGAQLLTEINDNSFLAFLYNNNLLSAILLKRVA